MAASSAASMNRERGWLAYRGDFHLRPTGQAVNGSTPAQVGLTVLGRPRTSADARPYLDAISEEASAASMNRQRGWLAYRGDFRLRPTGQAVNGSTPAQVGLTVPGRPRTSGDARPYLDAISEEASAPSMNRQRGWLAYRGDFRLRPTGQAVNGSTPAQVGLTVPGRPRVGVRPEVRHIIASRDEARPHALAADERGRSSLPWVRPFSISSLPKKNPGHHTEPGLRDEEGGA
jgi:hypothetical protein